MFDANSDLSHQAFDSFAPAFSDPETRDDAEAYELYEGRDPKTGQKVFRAMNGARRKYPHKPFDA